MNTSFFSFTSVCLFDCQASGYVTHHYTERHWWPLTTYTKNKKKQQNKPLPTHLSYPITTHVALPCVHHPVVLASICTLSTLRVSPSNISLLLCGPDSSQINTVESSMITLLRSAPDSQQNWEQRRMVTVWSHEMRVCTLQTRSLKSWHKDGHKAQARVMIPYDQAHMHK